MQIVWDHIRADVVPMKTIVVTDYDYGTSTMQASYFQSLEECPRSLPNLDFIGASRDASKVPKSNKIRRITGMHASKPVVFHSRVQQKEMRRRQKAPRMSILHQNPTQ